MQTLAQFQGLAWIASHPWLYPALEVVHIVGIGLLLGSLTLVELRLWGLGAALPVAPLARLGLRLTLCGFGIAAASGSLLFLSQPGELIGNTPFLVKMVLLACAGLNAVWFHLRGGLRKLDAVAHLQTGASVLLWIAVIVCGRWIAYE